MAQNDWAIVIGINEYEQHPERKLNYAVNDAQAMQEFLRDHAGFPEDQIVLCLGKREYQGQPTYPTASNLGVLLDRKLHPNQIGQADRFWFFFSGHGLSTEGIDYLITCESYAEDTQFKFMLPVHQVIASLRQHQRADVVLILDNCREQVGAKKLASHSLSRKNLELARVQDIVTIYSCEYGQFSYELADQQRGAFTSALLEGFREHTLPVPLESYLQRRVAALNQHDRQTPKISLNSSSGGQFPLLPERCMTVADLDILEKQALKAQAMGQDKEAERLWWQIIRVTPNQQLFDEAKGYIQFLYRKSLEGEIRQEIQQELNQLQQQATHQRQTLQQQQRKVEQLQQEKADLEQRLAQVQTEALKQVQQTQDSAQARINDLTATLETLQTQLAAKEQQKQDAIAAQTQQTQQIQALNQKIQTLEQQLKQASQPSAQKPKPAAQTIDEVPLESEKGVDYTKLRDLLKAQKWKEADQETADRMLEAIRENRWWDVVSQDLMNFPCKDIKTIDRLWVTASQGRYGFSVQKEIYVRCGAKRDGEYPGDEIWRKFGTEVGWRVNNSWLDYDKLTWNSTHVRGHLPTFGDLFYVVDGLWGDGWFGRSLLSHRDL